VVAAVDDDGGAQGTREGHCYGEHSSADGDHDHFTVEIGGVVPVLPRVVLAHGCSWF
jgi:hypothetical protein